MPDSSGISDVGIRRMKELWSISVNDAAVKIKNTNVYVLYGEKERQTSPPLVSRCKEMAKLIGAQLYEVAGAPHDMGSEVYSKAIVRMIKSAKNNSFS